jgi:hypothetical protein
VHFDLDHKRGSASRDDAGDEFDELPEAHGDVKVDFLTGGGHDRAARVPRCGYERRLVHQGECLTAEEGPVMVGLPGEDHLDEPGFERRPIVPANRVLHGASFGLWRTRRRPLVSRNAETLDLVEGRKPSRCAKHALGPTPRPRGRLKEDRGRSKDRRDAIVTSARTRPPPSRLPGRTDQGYLP